jgi:hypothetical protein
MDRLIDNELNNTITNEKSNEIDDFMKELQSALDNPINKITIDRTFYNEVYNDLELAPKYKEQLEGIIKDCMLDYSYDTEFVYVNYDEKTKKYYADIYDGDVTKVNMTKKELEDSDIKVGTFYSILNDGDYLEEKEYIKDNIKYKIEYELNKLEKSKNRRKDGQ